MIETNPYRLEEAEWTPGNVYDIIPPGDLSHTGFEYSEGSDNIDEGEVRNSLVSGVADFFGQLLGGIGKILGGAVEIGVGILGGIVDGITSFIGEIASAIGGLIPDGARATPIKDAVVAQIGPVRTQVGTLGQNLQELSNEVDGRISEQKDLIDDANVAIGEAKDLTAAVKALAEENAAKVSSAISKAEQGIKDAKTANDAIKSLNTSLNSKIEEQIKASEYLEGELAKADSSVTAVSDLVRLQNPWKWTEDWASGADITQTPTTMSMSTVAESNRINNRGVTKTHIPLIAGRTYRIRAMCKGSGTIQIGFYRTLDNGTYSSSIWVSGASKSFTDSVDHYIDWTCEYGENETKVQGVVYIRGVMTVESVVVQDISDLSLVQPQINEGFAMALKAHQTLFEGQETWNTTQDAINRFNSTQWAKQADLNKTNNEVNTAQNDAIAALQSATQLAIPDYDISPKTGPRPNWSNGLVWGAWVDWNLGKPNSVKMDIPTYVVDKTSWVVDTSDNSYFVPVEGMKLRIRAAIRAISSDSGGSTHVWLTDKDNKPVIVGDQYVEQRAQGQVIGYRPDNQVDSRDFCSVWTSAAGTNTNWTFWERVVEIKPNSGPIKIHVRNASETARVHFGCRISSVIPTQEAVDKAQNKAIEANTETIKHQIEINNLFQERMWSQLDMIEQLDIQQTRVVHMKANEGDLVHPPSWVSSGRVRSIDSPFLTAWNFGGNARWAAWQAKGKWEGKLKHTLNFTNGAADVYVHDITREGVRSMKVEGGAIFVANYRNSTFEIFPAHLGRTVGIRNPDSSGWYVDQSVMETGGPSMVRHQTADEIRFTTSFYSNLAFYARDIKGTKTLVKANQVVEPMIIRRADLRAGINYLFTEASFTTNTW